jgi:hypothetical protein
MTNDDKKGAKLSATFECKICDYNTCKKTNYERHIITKKHRELQNCYKNEQKRTAPCMVCECGKYFNHRQNLWKHKQKCSEPTKSMSQTDLINFLLKENQEFKQLIIDQSAKMLELAAIPKTTNTTMHCNNNNSFNLNLFLNEKCKDAMNIGDFINSFQIQSSDFEDMGKLGYIQGISNIFIKKLNDLDETARPLHCSDIKRETLYIKDNNVWDKDIKRDKMKQAIADIAHKNVKYIPIWTKENPDALDGTTKRNDEYMRIANQVMTAISPDNDLGINKIIRNVASRVCIEK